MTRNYGITVGMGILIGTDGQYRDPEDTEWSAAVGNSRVGFLRGWDRILLPASGLG